MNATPSPRGSSDPKAATKQNDGRTAAPSDRASAALDSSLVQHWIDGRPTEGHGRALDVFNPATGAVARQVLLATAEDVSAAVASAQAAFPSWADTPQFAGHAFSRAF
jgi:delta 1-pyrroline-5-carboxylate dehydrogenase